MIAAGVEIVGRDEELASLASFLEAAESGRALVVEGEAGIGKTTLWRAAVAKAESSGFVVLVCSPGLSERDLAFTALGDLLEPVLEEVLPELPVPQRQALEVALLREESSGAPLDPRTIAVALLSAVRVLARRGYVLVAVDDVQWLDAPSAGAVEFMARRLQGERAALLFARRIEADGVFPLDLGRLGVDTIRLAPITLGALHRLLRTRLGVAFPRNLLRRIHESTGGNPFFALELARLLQARGVRHVEPGAPLPVPTTLTDVLRARLAELPAPALDALRVAAALARPTLDRVAAARVTLDDLEPAVRAHVIELAGDEVRFTHPLLASTLSAELSPTERERLHHRLSDAVDDVEERARHLAIATASPDGAVAAILADAARRAQARGAPLAAAELLEHAVRLTPEGDAENWALRGIEAADCWITAGDKSRAATVAQRIVDTVAAGPVRAAALLRLADVGLQIGLDRGVELCEQAAVEAGDDPRVRAEALLKLSEMSNLQGEFSRALASVRAALELADGLGDPSLLVIALTKVGNLEAKIGVGDPDARFRRALELERNAPVDPFWGRSYWAPGMSLAVLLIRRGELAEARRLLLEQYAKAVAAGDEESHVGLCIHLSEVECAAGRFAEARRYADEAYDVAQQSGETHFLGVSSYARALAAAFAGDVATARVAAREGLALTESIGDMNYWTHIHDVLCFLEHSLGHHEEALEHRRQVATERPIEGHGRISYAGDEIEALLAVGRLDEADEKTAALESRANELGRRPLAAIAGRCRGLVSAATNDFDGATDSLEHALAEWELLPMPFERGRTLLVLGQVQRRAKQKRAARDSLEAALAIFEELGARLWADKARADLARISGRAPAGGLTPTEQRIADLVAEGRSNKEVAAELFVTVKTIERNLSRVYKKLGVRSRAELARRSADELTR